MLYPTPFSLLRRWQLRRHFFITLCLLLSFVWAQPPGRAEVDPASVTAVADTLRELVAAEVAASGGDLETQRVNVVFAFSTGHFGVDPNLAGAARDIAWQFVQGTLVASEEVSVLAWELDVWNHLAGAPNTVTLPESDPQSKLIVKDLWPLTPQAGSIGGHDTELAIVRAVEGLSTPDNTIILLFTNDAISVSSSTPLIGQNDPRYAEALTRFRRLARTSNTGASLEARLNVIRADGSTVERRLDVVLLVPRTFLSSPLGSTRSELLSAAVMPPTPEGMPDAAPASSGFPWLWLLVGVAFIIGLGGVLLRRKGAAEAALLEVNGQTFDLANSKEGREIFTFVGAGYAASGATVVSDKPEGARQELLKVSRTRGGIRLRGLALKVVRVNGQPVSDPHVLTPQRGQSYRLLLRGQVTPDPHLPPVPITDELVINALAAAQAPGKRPSVKGRT